MIISEEEKNRIRGLHKNHSIIKEQLELPESDVKWWEGKDESQMLDDLDTGAQMLKDYVSQIKANGGGTQEKDLRDIQEYIEYHITQFIGATEGVG